LNNAPSNAETKHLAERFRTAGDDTETRSFVALAVESHPGNAALRSFEANLDPSSEIIWRKVLLPPPSTDAKEKAKRKRAGKPTNSNPR
jgi:hypothetical protein